METLMLKMTRKLTHLLLGLSVGALAYMSYQFQDAAITQSSVEEIKHQGIEQIEKIKTFIAFDQLKKFIENNQSSDASQKILSMDKAHVDLEAKLSLERIPELDKTYIEYQRVIDKISNLSKGSEVLITLETKTARLQELAQKRRWSNLAKYSERFSQRINLLKVSGKLESPIVKFLESDLVAMTNLIKGSALDPKDKELVFENLETIKQDMVMLVDLHEVRKELIELDAKARQVEEKWVAKAQLAIGTLQKRHQDRLSGLVTLMWSLTGGLILSWFMIWFLWSRTSKAQSELNDETVMSIVNELSQTSSLNIEQLVSKQSQNELEKSLNGLRTKLELGDDFNKGIPFAAFLLNQEGQLTWANEIFLNQFEFDQVDFSDYEISLKDIQSKLISQDDYISHALNHFEPATWQVQLQMNDGVTIPLEMHLSPIDKDNEAKLLVIFYDLVLVKEAIQTQSHLIMHPVRAALDALESEAWSVQAEEQIAPLWKQVGLEKDWDRLSQSIHRMNQYRFDLLQQVKTLDETKKDQYKMIADLNEGLNSCQRLLKNQIKKLKDVRDVFVSLDQLNGDLQTDHRALTNLARSQAKRTEYYTEQCRNLVERLNSLKDSAQQLESVKALYKVDKSELFESKQKIMRLQNEFLMSSPMLSDHAQNLAGEIKDALMQLDKSANSLDKRLSSLDIEITKVAMAFTGAMPTLDKIQFVSDIALHEKVAGEILTATEEDQELMVSLLHSIVSELKNSTSNIVELQKTITEGNASQIEHQT